ncbi:MAG: GNAT family N-acetyltransferase [bacterium]|nr:GNAT family N-acetyltransferase [bacterium]
MARLIPLDMETPSGVETESFRIRPITIHDTIKDYDAVMTSVDHLRGCLFDSPGWPRHDLTLTQDMIDLAWHQKEGQRRRSFAFAVMSLDESVQLGCLYIEPPSKQGFDAEVSMWVRASEVDTGLDGDLYETVRRWVDDEWPFGRVAYPGREYTREEWDALP